MTQVSNTQGHVTNAQGPEGQGPWIVDHGHGHKGQGCGAMGHGRGARAAGSGAKSVGTETPPQRRIIISGSDHN